MEPLILVTNDDGIASPGLLAAAEAVAGLGELLVVAPTAQQTGMGRSSPVFKTGGAVVKSTLYVRGQAIPAYAIPGSPAQAVMYGVLALAGRRPDLALSGINYGENVGSATTASGTVGAALEAAAYGIPALAASLETDKAYHYNHGSDIDWRVATAAVRHFAQVMLAATLPFDVDILKIDVPAEATEQTPWRLTRQSRHPYFESFLVNENPLPELSHFDYRMTVDRARLEPNSDIYAFAVDRVISVTPLSIDLTARADFGELRALLARENIRRKT